MKMLRRRSLRGCILAIGLMIGGLAYAQSSAPASAPAPAAPPPSASAAELKDAAAKAPTTADLQKGDPGGTLTGTINDVPAADPKAGVTLPDVANQVGQNKIAINFTWTLICRLPGHVHASRVCHGRVGPLPGQECQPHLHDEFLRVWLWSPGLLADRLRHPDGRRCRQRKPGRSPAALPANIPLRCSGRRGASSAVPECSCPATPMTSA